MDTTTLRPDLEPPTCCPTDHALSKALGDEPEADIWQPHHDPWISTLIEAWTRRGLDRWSQVGAPLLRAIEEFEPHAEPLHKAQPWLRWDVETLAEVQRALEAKPRSEYTLDDWMTLIDVLMQTFWPEDVIQSEADYLTIRAHFAGQVKANLATLPSHTQLAAEHIIRISTLLPWQFQHIAPSTMNVQQAHILRIAAAQTANTITNLTANARARMKRVLLNGIGRITLGDRRGTWQALRSDLLDTFGDLNRDWRRIAITESGNAANVGFLSALTPGSTVRREEAYAGACPFCQSIRGRVATVVADDQEPKDWDNEVWLSKSNVGRSASPYKRDGSKRAPEELWTLPAGVVHPHCRGSWSSVDPIPGMSSEYQMWLRGLLTEAGLPDSTQLKNPPES